MDYPYNCVYLHPRLEEKSGIDKFTIRKAAIQVADKIKRRDPNPRVGKNYQDTAEVNGILLYMVWEFQENNNIYVHEARRASGRKRR